MKKRIALILFVFLLLCSCAENTEQSTIANGINPSGPSTIAEPSNVQALESYADVRGIDETKTLASGEYVPEDIRTYWFNENTIFEGNEALPEADKIRAVSVSADFTNAKNFDNHGAWDEAVKRAEDADILVLDCRREYDTCVFWPSCFDPDNRDDLARCKIGTPDGDFQDCPQQAMGTPVGYRTTAEVYDENEYSYSYDAIGGHSWAIPYGTGILALGWQLNPSLTGQELIELMRQTTYQNASGDCFINPSAFIDSVPQTSGEETDGETYYGTDPWLNDPDNPESEKWRHSFMTKPFFKNGYNIRLAWNNPPSLYETTRQIIAEQEYTVSFIEETKKYADDPQVLEAIRLCILERKQEEAEADGGLPEEVFLLTEPVVVDVDGPYEDADLQQVVRNTYGII